MRQSVREEVHSQSGHADVRLPARVALLRRLRVQTTMRLFVAGQVRRGGVHFAALVAHESFHRVRIGGGRLAVLLVGAGSRRIDDLVEFLKWTHGRLTKHYYNEYVHHSLLGLTVDNFFLLEGFWTKETNFTLLH